MTSIHGFMDGSYDYRQFYPKQKNPISQSVPTNTIMYELETNPNVSAFKTIVKKIPNIASLFRDTQSYCTLFVPINSPEMMTIADHYDYYELMKLIQYHTLDRAVSLDFLRSSETMTLKTKLNGFSLYIKNYYNNSLNGNSTFINETYKIVGYKIFDRSIVYFIDRPFKV